MKFIIALILAIPTYGISLILLFAYMAFFTRLTIKKLKNAIVFLSTDSCLLPTSIDGIPYQVALGFANEEGRDIHKNGDLIKFNISLNSKDYHVTLQREVGGDSAVLTSEDISWTGPLFSWVNQHDWGGPYSNIEEVMNLDTVKLGDSTYMLTREPIGKIPNDLCRLPKLKSLHVQYRQLTNLPKEITQLTQLSELKLGGNKLTKLPKEIVNLEQLKVLTMWDNDLTELPSEIGEFRHLEGLGLWGNPMKRLPDEITKLVNLQILELGMMENLTLTGAQKNWIDTLYKKGCDVWLDDNGHNAGLNYLLRANKEYRESEEYNANFDSDMNFDLLSDEEILNL